MGPPAPPILAAPVQVRTRLWALADDLKHRIPDDGLGPLIPHLDGLALGRPVTGSSLSNLTRVALPAVQVLVEGVTRGDVHRVDAGVRSLVGLGPGLTPSGDDFLAGMMVGLRTTTLADGLARQQSWHQQPPYLRLAIGDMLAECVKANAVDRTNLISCAILEHAAAGTGSGAIHHLLGLLLMDGANASILESALDVAKAGHTSGWDSLAGVLLGVHLGLQPANRAAAVW